MSRYTTFRIGGPADCFLETSSRQELGRAIALARGLSLPYQFIGWGSNLLVLDGGIRGVVIRLRGDFEIIEFLPGHQVRAGAGVRLPQLVSLCAEKGLGGDEPLVGVPGTVGGALVMNAGTREGEIGSLIEEVEIWDETGSCCASLPRGELRFSYRSSNLDGRLIVSCVLQLKPGDKVDIMKRVQQHQQRRLQTQPVHTYNVGSTFKNPSGFFVAKLIEDAGLKGFSFGGARVSPLHANFIENFSKARASDVLEVVRAVREKIRAIKGIDLELEMRVVGEP